MPTEERASGVIHVVDTLEVGGLERVVTDLAIAQHATGRRVAVLSINECAGFRGQLEQAGVPVVIGGKQGAFDRNVLRGLRALMADFGLGVVHTHNFVPNYYAALAMFALRPRPALVNTCHNMGTRLVNRRLRWLYRASLARTQRVALVGRQVHDHFVNNGIVAASRATTVMNAVPAERFAISVARRSAARAALGIAEGIPVLACVGRLVGLKNHSLLLAEVPALLREHPTLRVVIAGDGPLASTLQAQIDDLGIGACVTLLGSRPDIADLLPGFDVFVLPSKTEGLSIALLEACASGLAIVASAVGGNPEIIHHGETGLLVARDDSEALRTALQRLLADPGLRQRLGAAAAAWVVRHASIDALRAAYDQVYRDALDALR